jgi:hypothetical protein
MNATPGAKSEHSMTETVSRFLVSWGARARRKGSSKGVFVLDGAKVSDAELGGPAALLPLFAWHADNLYRYSIRQRGFGMSFAADEDALLGRSVNLDRTDRSVSEMLSFVLEAVEDARSHLPQSAAVPGAVELRSLVNRFAAEMGVDSTAEAGVPAFGSKPQA